MVEFRSTSRRTPWLSLYPDGVSPNLTPERGTALELFDACVRERPGHLAFWYFGRRFTYAELNCAADRLAAWLQANGVGRADRVAVILQNCPEFLMMVLAAWKLAAVPMPANPMYRAGELAKLIADAEPAAIVCEAGHRAQVEAAFAALGRALPPILTTRPESYRPETAVADPETDAVRVVAENQAIALRAVQPPGPGDLGLLLYTSGTTGVPKGAMVRHDSLAFNAQSLRDWCALGPDARVLAIAPFFHITGLVCHLLAAMSARGSVIAHYRFDAELVLGVIRETRPTFTIGAITAFNALMSAPSARPEDFESFERVYSGGAPIPPSLVALIKDRLGLVIHSSYGMTETSAPTHLAPFGATIPVAADSGALSIGIPSPSTDAIIVDEGDREVPPGEVGELLVRGPQIMQAYWRKPEDTAAALADGWMHTGDVGFQDADGWFYLVDRKKDVIIASGFKVWPREVEDVLYTHPAILEAAVVGVADSYRGETVKAYVSLRPGLDADETELIAHCRARLAAYKAPRQVEILVDLPKTVSGKIQRAALRKPGSEPCGGSIDTRRG